MFIIWKIKLSVWNRVYMYLNSFLLPSNLSTFPISSDQMHGHNLILPAPCITVGMAFSYWYNVGFLPNLILCAKAKKFDFGLIRPENHEYIIYETLNCISYGFYSLMAFFLPLFHKAQPWGVSGLISFLVASLSKTILLSHWHLVDIWFSL